MISLIMAIFNGEQYIEQQLESILNQSVLPDEIIFVDDCSQDNSMKIVKRILDIYMYKKYTLICHKENQGYIKSFCEGILQAKGDFIYLCDQDDIWDIDKIKKTVSIMKKNPKIMSLCTSFRLIDSHNNSIRDKILPFHCNHNIIKKNIKKRGLVKISKRCIIKYNISPGCTCVFNKELIMLIKNSNIDELSLPHDWAINILASFQGGLYFFNEELISYRQHEKNTIGLKDSNTIEGRKIKYEKCINEKKSIIKLINTNSKMLKFKNNLNSSIRSYEILIEILNTKKVLLFVKLILNDIFSNDLKILCYVKDLKAIKNK